MAEIKKIGGSDTKWKADTIEERRKGTTGYSKPVNIIGKQLELGITNSEVIPKSKELYFIIDKQNRAIKVGLAENPSYRLSALQTGNPNQLILAMTIPDASMEMESAYHRILARNHIRGEWFSYSFSNGEVLLGCEDAA